LANTRDLQQSALQRKSIAAQIKGHIDSVTAVLVLADGTVPRGTVGIDYALSTLSAIFPYTPFNNVAFLFTRISNPLCWNFCQDSLPGAFKDAPQFQIDNPIALQRRYLKLMDNPEVRIKRTYFRDEVKASEQDALEMLVDLFEWLGGLEPQPMSRIVPLYKSLRAPRSRWTKYSAVSCSTGSHLVWRWNLILIGNRL
jgi:hypothetical protein